MTWPTSTTATAESSRTVPVSASTAASIAMAQAPWSAAVASNFADASIVSPGPSDLAASATLVPPSFAWSACAAASAAPPWTGVTRLPPMPGSFGPSVERRLTRTTDGSIPSVAATIRWMSVCWPPPCSPTPVVASIRPSRSRRSVIVADPVPTWRTPSAKPTPRPGSRLRSAPISAAARSSSACRSGPCHGTPLVIGSPVRAAFRRRSSSGAMPSSRAMRSRCDSDAKTFCGCPGARMCPPGTWFV